MGRKAKQNLRKKNAVHEKQEHQRATEKNLRLSLMNMRQLYEVEVQTKLQLAAQLDELKIMIAAASLNTDGVLVLTQENLDRASQMDGIQVDPREEGGYTITLVEAPQEENADDAPESAEETEDEDSEGLH